ncbi:glyoxylate/hydroxypyruvate reductase A [Xanthobacter sp. KR7-225]|uniref:2-hydroxyacid dehydrogenase n=1 Tax=Xanthobacter sp. KR7-225 TaxID=3156613 RepID=UPI0032B5573D
MPETLLFHSDFDDAAAWTDALRRELPDLDVAISTRPYDPAAVRYALVWQPPVGFFAPLVNLALVTNLGAGVDALVGRADLPGVPVTRICDPEMARMMASFVLLAVLRHARDIPMLEQARRERRWHWVNPRTAGEITVGILGLGELGARAAREVAGQGFRVKGWSRSPKSLTGIETSYGLGALDDFLSEVEILVVMLPLTAETRHLLDARRLALLPRGAKLVNVARGAVVDEAALVEALRGGHLDSATLDVFEVEPLPQDSPLWTMENVLMTPHLASVAIPSSAAAQIAENIRRLRRGAAPLFKVEAGRGY